MNRINTLAATALALAASPALGQVVLSDSFDRTTGLNEAPIDGGFSDWGSPDNALGGSAAGDYLLVSDLANAAMEVTDGDNAILNFGRVILDYNIATDADVLGMGAVEIKVDFNPGNTGGPSFNGRDWLGVFLGDSNQLNGSIGAQFALTGGNPDARVGAGPRNSGSTIARLGPANIRAAGNPSAGNFNEPAYDPSALDDYIAWQAGGDGTAPGDPVEEFPNDRWYTLKLLVTSAPGFTLFEANAPHLAQLHIGPQGGTLDRVDFIPQTPEIEEQFSWGDNNTLTASGGTDTTPGVNDAYLVFVSNGADHRFDNLTISAVPEPAGMAVLGLGAAALLRRRA
ncbi:PEP-CTERM sorting domain-containing protein [Mucisphaera calidilacus]|uniref:Uncharacterized protein n=1 Tax=Mucisphaera calidilacus TaxID=2527982 RepID=A0A518BX57_9BACT|nr:PEP-CTERM sorting domain-containing protein [Mucisphaera calidilacus]QDU71524.1 hypothetical protein Pan265_13740 [Mucisphaera calidilacus]